MKKFFLGLLIGIFVTAVIPVGAAVEEYICKKAQYKVMIDGKEYSNDEQPILNYNGRTYFPRAFLEELGFVIKWNGELGQAEFYTPEHYNNMVEDNSMVQTTEDVGVFLIKGEKYIWLLHSVLAHYLSPSSKSHDIRYTLSYNSEKETADFIKWYKTVSDGIEISKREVLIANIPITRFPDVPGIDKRAYIKWDYFKNTIMPLVEH